MTTTTGWRDLFDGQTLTGWHSRPRVYGTTWPGGPQVHEVASWVPADYNQTAQAHPAVWAVKDGAIEGRQDPDHPGWGGCFHDVLTSENHFTAIVPVSGSSTGQAEEITSAQGAINALSIAVRFQATDLPLLASASAVS